jgi:predicted nucleic acid binding AN1-type Zn finger protein
MLIFLKKNYAEFQNLFNNWDHAVIKENYTYYIVKVMILNWKYIIGIIAKYYINLLYQSKNNVLQ